jgi:hypothetical protein
MLCMERLKYNWFLWFGFKNKRKPTKHPMQHVVKHGASRTIIVDVSKLRSKFEIVDGR